MDKKRVIADRYVVTSKIGSGSFGEVFECESLKTHEKYAAKVEPARSRAPQLAFEAKIYRIMSNCVNVPKIHVFVNGEPENALVMDLLGKSLEDIHEVRNSFSLKSVLMIIDQMLTSIEYFHEMGYLHRDIKPDNFVFGRKNPDHLYMIDFGLSKKYRDPYTHEHIKYVFGKNLTGTARYASLAALKGAEQSRRDDMEAMGYVWVYLLKGALPWMGLHGDGKRNKYQAICDCKARTTFEALCEGIPKEFVEYFKMVRDLQFQARPPYAEFRRMFRELFIRLGFVYDYMFDWRDPRKAKTYPVPKAKAGNVLSPDVVRMKGMTNRLPMIRCSSGAVVTQNDSTRVMFSTCDDSGADQLDQAVNVLTFSSSSHHSSVSSSLPSGWEDPVSLNRDSNNDSSPFTTSEITSSDEWLFKKSESRNESTETSDSSKADSTPGSGRKDVVKKDVARPARVLSARAPVVNLANIETARPGKRRDRKPPEERQEVPAQPIGEAPVRTTTLRPLEVSHVKKPAVPKRLV